MNAPMIVEGPDGAGKTRLATMLAEHYGLEYRKPPPALLSSTHGPADGLVDWWDMQLAQSASKLAGIVYDRCFYISDPIYQQAVPSRVLSVDSPDMVRGISRLWNAEPILIFCLPPWDVQLSNVMAHERERLLGVSAEALLKVNNAYWACYALWCQALYDDVMKYDYTEVDAWLHLIEHLDSVT
jgi:hypothetical protein